MEPAAGCAAGAYPEARRAMILTAVFLLSFSTLAFEVLLARVFSITQWNHLAFMVISIALFGFAAAGTFFSILDVRRPGWEARMSLPGPLSAIVLLFSASALTALLVIEHLPLDYFRLPLEPKQAMYLLVTYLLLAFPFFFSGMVVSLAYAAAPEITGRVYLVTMVGSAAGALLPIGLLPLLAEDRLAVATALVPLVWFATPAASGARARQAGLRSRPVIRLAVGALLVLAALLYREGAFHMRPSPYKDLS